MKIKMIHQSDAAECGLAALAMVAGAYGLNVSLAKLRQQFPLSLKGAQLNHMIHIAQQLGFSARPLRLDMEDFGKLKLPCILHWDFNHFVVLCKVRRSKVTILDPAAGRREMLLSECSEHFTGIALELTPDNGFIPERAAPAITLRQLTGPIDGLWSALGMILVLSLALQVFVVLAPFFMQWVVDHALVAADRDLLMVLGVGFGLAVLLQIGIGLLRGWSVVYLSARLGQQWMSHVFAHLLRLPLDFFEKRHIGDVVSRMASVQEIQKAVTTSFVEAIVDGLMVVVTFAMMLLYNWKLALISMLAVCLYCAIRVAVYRPFRERTEKQLVAAAKQQTHVLESLRGIQSLKVSGQESQRRAVHENLLADAINHEVVLSKMGLGFASASQFVFGLERIAVIWMGAVLAMRNIFSVGMLIAYLAYKDQFAQRMGALIDKWIEFRMLRLHGERLADIVLVEPEDAEPLPELPPPASTRIVVENLSFRYSDAEPWVIKDCSFSIEPGESVAIIGVSGCGKTTLLKLMLGLLKPESGTISVGGVDLHQSGPHNFRHMAGTVMQDDQLFAGSVAENISFFDADFDLSRIEAAARLADVHEEIVAMPMGYHSLIGDMGSSLSGGQKQRIILARALYRQPKLLFLDEATSHLDIMKERSVNQAISQLELTKVMVAHRRETIQSAGRVLVMEDGKIVQALQPQQNQ